MPVSPVLHAPTPLLLPRSSSCNGLCLLPLGVGKDKLTVGALRKALPPHIFEKNVAHSMWYLATDLTVIFACLRFYSDDISWPMYVIYANGKSLLAAFIFAAFSLFFVSPFLLLGLFMWCLFVVGHDCGHNTFSDSKALNAAMGHLSHGFILVPFWPWAKSHSTHHAYHQNKTKDKSHGWYDREDEGIEKIMKDQPFFIPFLYFFVYLLAGFPDGSHFNPFSSRLFHTTKDMVQCAVSSFVCVGFFASFVAFWGWERFVWIYVVPWLIFNFWLYKVTYLQHHGDGTIVYSDEAWDYLRGGLQTIDRVYDTNTGALDAVMHNITNGHVVHHLFSTSIPHYNLMEATEILRPQLGAAYKLVRGFPLVELIQHHWYSTRQWMIRRDGNGPTYWEFVNQDVYVKEMAAKKQSTASK
ncbi:fatty acid desaturase-domain-containing protein [Chytriomyces cf. hyalinus JEL632]|nr:fatty acid desaturase-domain-containing protein [Chytriomyces cf. hyalinus JEL632]